MAKRKKLPKLTPEELAQREKTRQMLAERIAYHDAKARRGRGSARARSELARKESALAGRLPSELGRRRRERAAPGL
jgi:hypothetical protein